MRVLHAVLALQRSACTRADPRGARKDAFGCRLRTRGPAAHAAPGAARRSLQLRPTSPAHFLAAAGSAGDQAAESGGGAGGAAGEHAADDAPGTPAGPASPPEAAWLLDAALLQRFVAATGPPDVLAALGEAAVAAGRAAASGGQLLTPAECEQLLDSLVTLRRVPLANEVYQAMRASAVDTTSALSWRWPPLSVGSSAALVRALARALAIPEALSIIESLRWRGAPGASAASPSAAGISFGMVIRCPHCAAVSGGAATGTSLGAAADPERPATGVALALVQPQEGVKRAACSACRYDFELFSGTVRSASSQASAVQDGPLALAARAAASLFRTGTPAAAAHELDVVTPGGAERTFRVGTPGPEVPASVGQRVTVVCAAPDELGDLTGVARSKRDRGIVGRLIPARPPRTAAGEPLEVTNHSTERVARLVRAPAASGTEAVPSASSWVPTLLLLTAAGEGASALVDPALPLLLLGGAAAVSTASVAVSSVVLPRLAQLPTAALTLESMRQELLQQHAALCARAALQADAAAEDVRTLGRLWQLEAKIAIVGDAQLYAARLQRVRAAREGIGARLGSRLSLLSRLARVAAMIEIEVELDTNVAAAEFAGAAAGIVGEIAGLSEAAELAELADTWRNTAAASDEVERLLREV